MRILRMLLLVALQVIVLNRISLLGYVTPLIIGYMVVCLHQGTSRMVALLWGFAIGVLFDMFSNTAGMASAACTLIAMMQPPFLSMFVPRDAPEKLTPSFSTIGTWSYTLYVFVLMLVFNTAFYLLDAFTLNDWRLTLYAIGGSTLMSTGLVIISEMIVRRKKEVLL